MMVSGRRGDMTLASYRSPKTVIGRSSIAGRGLFADVAIAQGEIVCVKGGHLLSKAEFEKYKGVANEAELQIADDLFLAPVTDAEFETVMMFLNHSCEPNVGIRAKLCSSPFVASPRRGVDLLRNDRPRYRTDGVSVRRFDLSPAYHRPGLAKAEVAEENMGAISPGFCWRKSEPTRCNRLSNTGSSPNQGLAGWIMRRISSMSDKASVGQAYIVASRHRLAECVKKIKHCLAQLSDEQVWWRPHDSMNSIANIILHLCGNLRQWIVSGIGGEPDIRDRPKEFSERSSMSKAELIRRLDEIARQADAVLAGVTDLQLLESRRIQGFGETVLSSNFDSLSHFQGHTQEIVFITRLQLGDAYKFEWVPTSREQGGP